MKIEKFIKIIDADFYTGIPDSQLKALCNYLMNTYGIDSHHHIIAANEGNCVGLAAGYHVATGRTPVVYLQNSGEGNVINPIASLINDKVYAIPMIFIIGWRGQPGIPDEPQHIYQGEVTICLLDDMNIPYFILNENTTENELKIKMAEFRGFLNSGKQVAFVVCKNALSYDEKTVYENQNKMRREEIIRHIVSISDYDPIISSTGKASRELFEIRKENGMGHQCDFLTVGSMGHNSSIALGVALNKPDKKIWCIDGDGSVLMHMGSMAIIGAITPKNFVHIVLNNESHETVGGMPTVANKIDFVSIAKACGYQNAVSVDCFDTLDKELAIAKQNDMLCLIEVKCSIGARTDLGRPTITPQKIKEMFMKHISDY